AGRQARTLARGVHAADPQRGGGQRAQAQQHDREQGSHRDRGLDGAHPLRPAEAAPRASPRAHTEVRRALSMIPPSAETIESPVTTVYRIAPNAASAIVPTAYSTVLIPSSSTATPHIAQPARLQVARIRPVVSDTGTACVPVSSFIFFPLHLSGPGSRCRCPRAATPPGLS